MLLVESGCRRRASGAHGLVVKVPFDGGFLDLLRQLARQFRICILRVAKNLSRLLQALQLVNVPFWLRCEHLCCRHIEIELLLWCEPMLFKVVFLEERKSERP